MGNDVWVQTPAYECPIEPHYLGLFVHHLPKRIQKSYISWFTLFGWMERPSSASLQVMINEIRLLKKHEMVELFPGCDIVTERLFYVLPKSYIAIRKTGATLGLRDLGHS